MFAVIKSLNKQWRVDGSINFRDIGGYRTIDGRIVKTGMMYRSGNLSRLTENGKNSLIELGIKRIIDLRGIEEVSTFADPVVKGIACHHTPLLSDEKILGQIEGHTDFATMLKKTKPGEFLLTLNQSMVTYRYAFQQVFNVILTEPESPFLFHCMAGKDRTGAISALLLSLLGVSREDILADYLFTNEQKNEINTHFDSLGYNHLSGVDQEILDALFEAREEYLNAFLNEIVNNFGSIEQYTKKELGLTPNEINLFKENFLR